jgi:60 kDa SS-A/Ro ribonucleoprotein
MKTNTKKESVRVFTGGGAVASNINPELALRRAVLTNFLWEDLAYESGTESADNISSLVPKVKANVVADIAREARSKQYLRHVPLYIVREMVKHDSHKPFVSDTLGDVVQRADELSEFLSLYWKDGKTPIAASVRKGLAKALTKFDEFQLARYAGESKNIKLKDVIKLIHPKPSSKKQAKLWKSVIEGTLKTPDTWEAELSENGNNKESWTRLLSEKKVGGLALLRNLRNIQEAGVEDSVIEEALATNLFKYVLPFRFMTAARYAPRFQRDIEKAMLRQLDGQDKLKGKTVVVVDVSGSMGAQMSGYSENTRLDVASSLAVILREISEDVVVYCTAGYDSSRGHKTEKIANPRRGFELVKQIEELKSRLGGGGIFLRQCTEYIANREDNVDRVVVISDSQDCDAGHLRGPEHSTAFGRKHNYVLDIAAHKNGIAYNKFTVINGFSEKVVDFMKLYEDLCEKADESAKAPKPVRRTARKSLN